MNARRQPKDLAKWAVLRFHRLFLKGGWFVFPVHYYAPLQAYWNSKGPDTCEQSRHLLKNGGQLILSTPYHGYLKNLAISPINGWDPHCKVVYRLGTYQVFSKRTLAAMACNAGFRNPCFLGVGRLPWLWKSMIMSVQK